MALLKRTSVSAETLGIQPKAINQGKVVAVEMVGGKELRIDIYYEATSAQDNGIETNFFVAIDGMEVPAGYEHVGTAASFLTGQLLFLYQESEPKPTLTYEQAAMRFKYTVYRGVAQRPMLDGRADIDGVMELLKKFTTLDERGCIRMYGKLTSEGHANITRQEIGGERYAVYLLEIDQ